MTHTEEPDPAVLAAAVGAPDAGSGGGDRGGGGAGAGGGGGEEHTGGGGGGKKRARDEGSGTGLGAGSWVGSGVGSGVGPGAAAAGPERALAKALPTVEKPFTSDMGHLCRAVDGARCGACGTFGETKSNILMRCT